MKNLKQLLTSKRFGVAVTGVLIVIFNDYLGLDLDTKSLLSIVGLVIAFVVSQGSADKGKEAAKILTEKSDTEEVKDWIDVFPKDEDDDKAKRGGWPAPSYPDGMPIPDPPQDDDPRPPKNEAYPGGEL